MRRLPRARTRRTHPPPPPPPVRRGEGPGKLPVSGSGQGPAALAPPLSRFLNGIVAGQHDVNGDDPEEAPEKVQGEVPRHDARASAAPDSVAGARAVPPGVRPAEPDARLGIYQDALGVAHAL